MLLDQITAAGIVGCGGAGFPTAVKYIFRFGVVLNSSRNISLSTQRSANRYLKPTIM